MQSQSIEQLAMFIIIYALHKYACYKLLNSNALLIQFHFIAQLCLS